MATHDPIPVEEFEYGFSLPADHSVIALLTSCFSYEALPPSFSLADNMLAGAFAGIAVSFCPMTLNL